jgi:protein ImuB
MAKLFAPRLEGIDAAFGFDAMTLAATETGPLDAAQLGAPTDEAPTEIPNSLIDTLASRLGEESVKRLAPRESHLPERAVVEVPALAVAPPAKSPFVPPGAPARPLRLLERPEPVDAVALWPYDPPALFRWRRVAHRVVRAEGPERIAPEWWRESDNGERDYWRLEDEYGRRFWLYRAGLAWYVQGVYGC